MAFSHESEREIVSNKRSPWRIQLSPQEVGLMPEQHGHRSPHKDPAVDRTSEENAESRPKPNLDRYPWASALIGWVLQGGVLLSAAVILFGMLLLPTRPGGLSTSRLLVFPFTGPALVSALAQFHPQG